MHVALPTIDLVNLPATTSGRVLLIDDDARILRLYAHLLVQAGFTVETLADGSVVKNALAARSFDLVITDLSMPTCDGIEVLQAVHRHDPELPVVLMTGSGDLGSALKAIEHGVLRYLLKPVSVVALRSVAEEAVRLGRVARQQRRMLDKLADDDSARDRDQARLDRAISTAHMLFQPIMRTANNSAFAFEALIRNHEDSLRRPDALFALAEKLDRVPELGRAIRRATALTLTAHAAPPLVFVNLHPLDLHDEDLFDPAASLSQMASRIVLEITERGSLESIDDLRERLARLRALGYRLALDDLGAGYAGLSSLAHLEPDIVKLDMSLVRGIDRESTKQRLVRTMVSMCAALGMLVIVEGVETTAERDVLLDVGCELMQGYLFGKPAPLV